MAGVQYQPGQKQTWRKVVIVRLAIKRTAGAKQYPCGNADTVGESATTHAIATRFRKEREMKPVTGKRIPAVSVRLRPARERFLRATNSSGAIRGFRQSAGF